jgi:hypothetical protein
MLTASSLPEIGSTNTCLFFLPVVVHALIAAISPPQQRMVVVASDADVVTEVKVDVDTKNNFPALKK